MLLTIREFLEVVFTFLVNKNFPLTKSMRNCNLGRNYEIWPRSPIILRFSLRQGSLGGATFLRSQNPPPPTHKVSSNAIAIYQHRLVAIISFPFVTHETLSKVLRFHLIFYAGRVGGDLIISNVVMITAASCNMRELCGILEVASFCVCIHT